MRKGLQTIMLSSLLLAPALTPPSYAGDHRDGFVTIHNSTTGPSSMSGTINVRFNPGRPNSYISVFSEHNETNDLPVYFSGRDDEGNDFYCTVSPRSALYAAALDIESSFSNGSYLEVTKALGSNECSSASLATFSYYLD